MAETFALEPRSAFAGLLGDIGPEQSAGVTLSARAAAQAATVIARARVADIAARLRAARGLELREGAKRSAAGDLAFVGIGPRAWLAVSARQTLVEDLRRDLGEAAAVSDQSSGYAILRLSGPKLRAALEKGVGVDLHPRAFAPDDAAITGCAHFGVILWQIDAAPTFEIAVARSFVPDFCHWLLASAAEFGVKIRPPG